MKWMRNILFLLVVFAFSAVELSAQATSSAVQMVTFGVRRISLQVPTASFVANTLTQSPTKVTVGSQSRFQSAVELATTTTQQTISPQEPAVITGVSNPLLPNAARESNFYNSKSPNTTSKPSGKQIVTFTE
jgi:hypothetical protein